jgi:membrane fusion protein (multidrug efflux system)
VSSRLFVLAVCFGLLTPSCKKKAPPAPSAPPPVVVETVAVEPKPFTRTVEAIATLRSPANTEVTADIAGKVVHLDVPEGKPVKKGHVLARLDASQVRAELQIARTRQRGAQDTLERSKALAAEQIVSKQMLDEARVARQMAHGEVSRSAALLDKTVIRAPFSGIVGIREVSLGAFIAPGSPITRITDVSALEIVFSVPERYVSQLEPGKRVHGVVGACEQRFTGELGVIDPFVDPVTRSIRVQAQIDNAEGRLRPGMSARVKLDLATIPQAIVIPQEALVRRGTQQQVFVVGAGDSVEARDVQVGEIRTGSVEILSGLAPQERIVAAGHQRLRPKAKVRPKPYAPVQNPNLGLGRPDGGAGDCWF